MDKDLKWNSDVEYITKRAGKKLYSLRVLRIAGVYQANFLKIYLSTVPSFLEYAVLVWQAIPAYLADVLERIQKRALHIIYPEAESYAHALQFGELDSLDNRRDYLCNKDMIQMKSPSHPLLHLLPSPLLNEPKYNLRRNSQKYYLFKNTIACSLRTKRAENSFTFRYFKQYY